MSGVSIREMEQYSIDLKSTAISASSRLGAELAGNAVLSQEEFAEKLAQERFIAIQEMQFKSQSWADRALAEGDLRKAELFQSFSDTYADIAVQRTVLSGAEFNALTDAIMLDLFGRTIGVFGDAYSAGQAYSKYSQGDIDGASATLVGMLGGMAGWYAGVAIGGIVIGGPIAWGIGLSVALSILSENAFPGWDSIFDSLIEFSDETDHLIGRLRNLFISAENDASPIILDLDGDGVETVSRDAGIHFDHNKNGFAELTGWVGTDDGLLVWDRDGNGFIDNGEELFGNNTALTSGGSAANGFVALAQLDNNADGVINANDAAWASLRVWQDTDQNGVTGDGELLTLDEAGVAALNLGYTNSTHIDAAGNAHKQVGSFVRTDGTTGVATDVWFAADHAYSREVDILDVPEAIQALPNLRGFGNVHSLHQAMVRDQSGDLQALVEQFASETTKSGRDALMDQILYVWTGVEEVPPESRGDAVDARHLGVLEMFLAELLRGSSATVAGVNAGATLELAYGELKSYLQDRMMMQTHYAEFMEFVEISVDSVSQDIDLDFVPVVPVLLERYLQGSHEDVLILEEFLLTLQRSSLFSQGSWDAFRQEMSEQNTFLGVLTSVAGTGAILGSAGADVLTAVEHFQKIYGGDGNDTLLGGLAQQSLYGGAGNDVISSPFESNTITSFHGETGDDLLIGSGRGDYYYFNRGDGQDTIDERGRHTGWSENDRLYLQGDITPDEVVLTRDGLDLLIKFGESSDQIRVLEWYGTSGMNRISELRFSDGTIWDQGTLHARGLVVHGGASNDELVGLENEFNQLYGGDGDDTLIAANLSDTLYGGAGNDVLSSPFTTNSIARFHGGTGDDLLIGSGRGDYYYFNRGDGQDIIDERGRHTNYLEGDRLYLQGDIAPGEVEVTREGLDLLIRIGDGTDQIRVLEWYDPSGMNRISELRFADGTIWNQSTVHAKGLVVDGGAGNDQLVGLENEINQLHGGDGDDTLIAANLHDTLYGGAGNDVLLSPFTTNSIARFHGGTGDDLLIGSGRGDYYYFNRGDGQDIIDERGRHTNYLEGDRLYLQGDIAPGEVEVTREGLDLLIRIGDGTDQIRVLEWYDPSGMNRIDEVRFGDGTIWHASTLSTKGLTVHGDDTDELFEGMAGQANFMHGHGGNDTLKGHGGNDTLIGGTGNDLLEGGAGSDHYFFAPGDGQDRIIDYQTTTNTDVLEFTDPIRFDQIWFVRAGNDLVVSLIGSDDNVTVTDWYLGSAHRIEQIRTVDGVLPHTSVDALVDAMSVYAAPSMGETTLPEDYRDALIGVLTSSWQLV